MTRKLIEQMLAASTYSEVAVAITAAREYLAQPESEARTEQSEPPKGAVALPAKPAGAPYVVKYRNPLTHQTWTGRGLKPRWVALHLEAGGSMDDLLVTAEREDAALLTSAEQLVVREQKAITAAKSYLAQPEQSEPVAWRYQDARGNYRYRGYVKNFDSDYKLLKPVPLYTQPKAPEPLTDEEIYAAIRPLYTSESLARNVLEISIDEYRAVLAAQRSKG